MKRIFARSLPRRRFLRHSALVVAPLFVAPAVLGRGGAVAPGNRLVMGCVGVGGQGTRQMAGGIWSPPGGFIAQPGVQVVAVADANAHNRNRARDIVNQHYGNQDCAAHADFREVTRRADVDIILCAAGDRWHSYISADAVKHGKDVYSEKPISVTIAEARALAERVRQYGRILQVGTQQRSMGNFRLACELVRNGYIGALKRVTGDIDPGVPPVPDLPAEPVPEWLDWDLWLGPAPWRPYNARLVGGWMGWYDYSGGDMTNWGAHVWDIVQWGLGMDDSGPVEIIPANGKDVKHLTYRYANGVPVIRNKIPGVSKGVLFEGTQGWVKVSREVFETEPASLRRQIIGPNEIHLHESDNHHTDFLRSVRTRVRNAADAEVACRSITVCHLGNIADQLGRTLRWDPRAERFVNDPEADRFIARAARAPWAI